MFTNLKNLVANLPVTLTDEELRNYRNSAKTRKLLQQIKVETQKLRVTVLTKLKTLNNK